MNIYKQMWKKLGEMFIPQKKNGESGESVP